MCYAPTGTRSGPFKLNIQSAGPAISRLQDEGACGLKANSTAGLLAFCLILKYHDSEAFNENVSYRDILGGANFDMFLEYEVEKERKLDCRE